MPKNICPICSKGELLEHDGRFETRYKDRKGAERVLVLENLQRLACSSCGEEILNDAASRKVEEARRLAMGLLGSADICELRARFRRSQVQMSKLLGVGEKTYCRWESGAFVQSVAFDNYLRLLRDIPEASAMLMRLEHGETAEETATSHGTNAEFTFLKNIDAIVESETRFTRLMASGMLQVAE